MVRLSREEFDYVLNVIKCDITGRKNNSVPPDLQLLVTLHFLAHGSSKIKTAIDFDLGEATITKILDTVTLSIIKRLSPVYLSYPETEEWVDIEKGFNRRWNVPNMLGAVDGKHFRIQKPAHSGSSYHNYKGFFSISIMALVDHEYKFRVVDVGGLGSDHDGGFLKATHFGEALYEGNTSALKWPPPKALPGMEQTLLPHFIVGDDAFQLNQHVMKPYPGFGHSLIQKIYNYRISRGRMIVENAFGILAARWRIFQTPMISTMDRAKQYIYASIIMHNMLCSTRTYEYIPQGYVDEDYEGNITDGLYRQEITGNQLRPLVRCQIKNSPKSAGVMRKYLANYFVSGKGRLSWQANLVTKGG